ncbi:hypothetical protein J2Z32_003746 [Paenibacillus turicensis]|uniref:Uncharacterized protein n=1 Tax=Paenibacillus turicensis TaxID=160487 RepID=A0ABS4FWX1_9BACL|nr:hypothetical protein [Paenibacillus turicensis]MBP1907081.1 hypothetical protein [Paenibacillus turicensis]
MAKYPVLKKFRDKETRNVYEVGSAYETDNKERAKKLQAGEWVGKELKPSKPKNKPDQVEEGDLLGNEADQSEKVQSEDSDSE